MHTVPFLNMRRILLLILGLGLSGILKAQYYEASRHIGFNANPLLAQLIPLNSNNPEVTHAALMFRRYNANNNGFRAAYGVGISSRSDFTNMYLGIDLDRRRRLSNNWEFFTGPGANLRIVSNNLDRTNTATVEEEFFLGLLYHWGVEFHINEIISVSTETNLMLGLGLDNDEVVFKLEPPINIFLHFNILNE